MDKSWLLPLPLCACVPNRKAEIRGFHLVGFWGGLDPIKTVTSPVWAWCVLNNEVLL